MVGHLTRNKTAKGKDKDTALVDVAPFDSKSIHLYLIAGAVTGSVHEESFFEFVVTD
jgi:hypothetical protein